jgi:hypothetical protein
MRGSAGVTQAYAAHNTSQLSGCVPGLVPVAIEIVPMRFTRRHQPLSDLGRRDRRDQGLGRLLGLAPERGHEAFDAASLLV